MSSNAQLFVLIVVSAIVVKWVWDDIQGAHQGVAPGSFSRFEYAQKKRHVVLLLSPKALTIMHRLKYVSAIMVLLDITSSLSWAVISAILFYEFTYDKKYHTQLLFVCGFFFSLLNIPLWSDVNTLPNAVLSTCITLVVLSIYVSTGLIKIRSKSFMSGEVILQTIRWYSTESCGLRTKEFLFGWRPSSVILSDHRTLILLRVGSSLVALSEIIIAPLLLIPATFPIAVVLGISLHLVFLVLFPMRLIAFQATLVASYILIYPPNLNSALDTLFGALTL